eukprot:gene23382-28374_t
MFASRSLAGLVFGPRHSFFGKEISTLSSASSATSDNDDNSFVQAIDTLYDNLELAYYQKEADPAREWVESILASSRGDDNPAEVPRLVMLAKTGRMFLDLLENKTIDAYNAAYDTFPFLQSTLNNTDVESRTYGQLATFLSRCYENALGTKENATEALRLLEIAAKQDLALAQKDLSSHYFNGCGVSENEEQGVYWLRRAAEQGDADACYQLASYYFDNDHNNSNAQGSRTYTEEVMQLLRVASHLNHLEAQVMLGAALVFNNDTDHFYYNFYDDGIDSNNSSPFSQQEAEGVSLLKDAAERGRADAQYYYSVCLMVGRGNVEKDPHEAFHWLYSAATQGQSEAELALGDAYRYGNEDLSIAMDYQKAVFWLSKAADKGIGRAQIDLGHCYRLGLGVEQDLEKAVFYFRQAANSSDASNTTAADDSAIAAGSALFILGQCYRDGQGVQQNNQEAFRLFRVVAEKYNRTVGQKQVGDCYALGLGVDKDLHEAMRWYHVAAEQEDADAQNALGLLLWEHPDLNNTTGLDAEAWFERAAVLGLPMAMYNLGMTHFNKEHYLPAVRWFKKAAELDEANSLVVLAGCYAEGLGVTVDHLETFHCLEKAVSLNNSMAQNTLGSWYYYGNNVVNVDFRKACDLFVLAAKQNHSEAEYMVGMCCFNGQGAKQNYTSAVRYFRRATSHAKDSNTTNMEAQHMLGVCLQQGLGTPKDLPAAFRLFNESAQAGYMDAQYSLGLCYRDGLGVRIDLAKARYWLREAADQGHDMARKSVHSLGKQNSQK